MTALDILDRFRLDVERDLVTGELVNLIQNATGEFGGWGWVTPVAGSAMVGLGVGSGAPLTYNAVASTPNWFYSERAAVTSGYVAASWVNVFLAQSGIARARLAWYDAAGTETLGTQTAYQTTNGTYSIAATAVPAGAVQVALRFDLYSNTSAANPTSTTRFLYLLNVTMARAATAAELGGTPHTNLVTNSSFETNTTGWDFYGGTGARVTTPTPQDGTGAGQVTKTAGALDFGARFGGMPVVPGQAYSGSGYVRSGTVSASVTVYIDFLSAGGNLLASTGGSSLTTNATWQRISYVNVVAPAGAVTARVVFDYVSGSTGTVLLDAVLFEQSSTLNAYYAGTFYSGATLPALPPAYYTSITAESAEISIEREELNLSTLSATVISTALDPSQSTLLRPGRSVRALVNVAASGDPDDWQPVFTGETQKASVEYRLLNPDDSQRAIITLTAVDALTRLAQESRPNGVGTIAALPYVLEGCGVPWSVNGSGNQVPTATVVAVNDQATAIDQVAITRDSVSGYAWVDRRGILQAWDAATISTSVVDTLDEDDYNTDFGIDFATDRVVNIVSIDAYEVIAGETVTVNDPPVRDEASIRQWGAYQKTFTVQGRTAASRITLANAILAANKTPTRRVDHVVLLPLTLETVDRALLDLYDLVTVVNARADLSANLRIVGVTHTITADQAETKWLTRLDFASDGSVAPPQIIPKPSTAAGLGTLYEATNTSTGSITTATVTDLGAWTRSPSLSGSDTYFSAYSAGTWTFSVAGTYLLTFSYSWSANATGRRIAILKLNGNEVRRVNIGAAANEMTIQVVHQVAVVAGDTVTTSVYQSSGAGLALSGGTTPGNFQATKIG